jgi:hypothetical protein
LSILPLAMGMALTMTPLTTLIMSSVPLGKAGVGSAMNDTTRELGGALGVAVLGSLVTSRFTSSLGPVVAGLPEQARERAESGLAGALGIAERLGGAQGEAIAEAAREAFVSGIGLAASVAAVVVLVAAAASAKLLPSSHLAPALGLPTSGSRADADRSAAGEVVDEGAMEPAPVVD